MTRLVRQFARRVIPLPVRTWVRARLFGGAAYQAAVREQYEAAARTGADNPNPWIRKSADIGGWLFVGEHEFLWELATREHSGDILEIGTWMGKSACIFAGACKEHAPGTRVICVDTFCMTGTADQEAYHRRLVTTPGTFYDFLANARRFGFDDVVVPIATYSDRALAIIRGALRMAFVDGAHDKENCERDVELCLSALAPGGILAIHDATGGGWPGVEQYVNEVLHHSAHVRHVGTRGTIVAFEKVA
jgi:predicted O-methyltransferase YrrM